MKVLKIMKENKIGNTLISVIVIFLLFAFIGQIQDSWYEMWYEFGRHLYHLTH